MASISSITKAGALIALPITGTARNVFTKMDDHGYFASLTRLEGESITNFKTRMASTYTRPGNATIRGLTDAIVRELNLGHEELISVTSSTKLKLDIGPESIVVSGATTSKVPIITVDQDGFWILPTIGKVVSGLNNINGIVATTTSSVTEFPAILLEEQSSYITEFNERTPPAKDFRLGYYNHGQEIIGTLVSGSVSFTDKVVFATEVSGAPQSAGEWSINTTTNTIHSYELPQSAVSVIYTRSLLESGMTMSLIGNGVKVMNLMLSGVQHMLFHNSGVGITGQGIVDELRVIDGAFWGK